MDKAEYEEWRFNKNRSCIEIEMEQAGFKAEEPFNKNRSCIEICFVECQVYPQTV